MPNDFEIGRVVAIDSAQVTVELNRELKALTRSTYEGTETIGQINSYIIIPVGAQKIVAMITRVMMTEEAELKTDKTMVTLPSSRRIMKATMIGTIDGQTFRQGISCFPILDNSVRVPTRKDLDAIFGCGDTCVTPSPASAPDPGYCISIGQSVVFPEFSIQVNPDVFFGKHAAILGSTGSGKSCTVATVIQSVLAHSAVKRTHFVILDTNGEYRQAFTPSDGTQDCRCLYIPTDPNDKSNCLAIPYWFMNSDDFSRLYQADPSKQTQRPVLLDALRLARSSSQAVLGLRTTVREELIDICSKVNEDKSSATTEDKLLGLKRLLEAKDKEATLFDGDKTVLDTISSLASSVREYVGEPDRRRFGKELPIDQKTDIKEKLGPLIQRLSYKDMAAEPPPISPDNPLFFQKQTFRDESLEQAMQRNNAGGAKTREYCATMLMRIDRLLDDQRFQFLFGPVGGEWPDANHSLATFLRDILGLPPQSSLLSSTEDVAECQLPFYDRQRDPDGGSHNVVVIDLSLLASEVLENVTALIGRLILEFLQRLNDPASGVNRGDLPVVLVLEEAQNYIGERKENDQAIARDVFEKIAREGRKYGLGLVVASQRPSELSKTVLSQCNSFIVHRLQNPEDLRYFKEIVPGIYGEMLNQLPALAQRHALVLGACVQAPALVHMREAKPTPKSNDPRFFEYWTADDPIRPNVEAVCAKWEGRTNHGQTDTNVEADVPDRTLREIRDTSAMSPDFASANDGGDQFSEQAAPADEEKREIDDSIDMEDPFI